MLALVACFSASSTICRSGTGSATTGVGSHNSSTATIVLRPRATGFLCAGATHHEFSLIASPLNDLG